VDKNSINDKASVINSTDCLTYSFFIRNLRKFLLFFFFAGHRWLIPVLRRQRSGKLQFQASLRQIVLKTQYRNRAGRVTQVTECLPSISLASVKPWVQSPMTRTKKFFFFFL
jgi:hypothetical protein